MGEWNEKETKVIKGFAMNREEITSPNEPIKIERNSDLSDEDFRKYFEPLIVKIDALAANTNQNGYTGGEWHMIYHHYCDVQEQRREELIVNLKLTDEQKRLLRL